jgi:hypothetical protein
MEKTRRRRRLDAHRASLRTSPCCSRKQTCDNPLGAKCHHWRDKARTYVLLWPCLDVVGFTSIHICWGGLRWNLVQVPLQSVSKHTWIGPPPLNKALGASSPATPDAWHCCGREHLGVCPDEEPVTRSAYFNTDGRGILVDTISKVFIQRNIIWGLRGQCKAYI